MSNIANTPTPPYYAVIFTSELTDNITGYQEMAERMLELAEQQPGFLGIESARETVGITVSYWQSTDAIAKWKAHCEHLVAQKLGHSKWYANFQTRICLVERDYGK